MFLVLLGDKLIGLDEASLGYLSVECTAENVERRHQEEISVLVPRPRITSAPLFLFILELSGYLLAATWLVV